jgi:CRP/FNR family transcriptional regulator, cyclic AMP receptor protein
MVDASLLESCELFVGLEPGSLDAIAKASDERTFERGDIVFRQDDPADELYIVVSGRFAMATRSIDGRESMLALMEHGDLFGEMSLFDGQRRSADARALDRSTLVAVPFAPVHDAFRHQPDHLWNVVALLAMRLRATDEALADAMFLDVPGRTAKRLLELAGDADEFHLTLTQEELAQLVGASRERVNKAIAQFVRLGWIEQLDRRYRLLDRDQLSRRAR